MHRAAVIGSAVLVFAMSSIFLPGCASTPHKPALHIAEQFSPQTTNTYEVGTTVTKDFKFEQPALNKLRQEETSTKVSVKFDQAIESVDPEGWATANITIRGLTCKMVKQNEVQVDYDSSRQADQKNPLQKLIGQSYTVRLSPDGKAEVVDASKVKVSGISGLEGRLAKRMFTDEEIIKRHEVPALPESSTPVAVGSTWERIVASPPGLLSSKSFLKVYTLKDVKTENGEKQATITMNASESAVPAKDAQAGSGGLGIFAKMLDNEDEYTGQTVIDPDTGKVLNYTETLISSYIAQEPNPNAKPDQGPDTLVIRFIQSVDRKLID